MKTYMITIIRNEKYEVLIFKTFPFSLFCLKDDPYCSISKDILVGLT